MDLLVKATLLRTFGFLIWVFLSAWVFVMVEDTDKDDSEEKYELLLSLYHSMALKYNMSVEEFSNFSSIAYEALSEPKPPWSFSYALDFVLQTVTTIGKAYIIIVTKEKNVFRVLLESTTSLKSSRKSSVLVSACVLRRFSRPEMCITLVGNKENSVFYLV